MSPREKIGIGTSANRAMLWCGNSENDPFRRPSRSGFTPERAQRTDPLHCAGTNTEGVHTAQSLADSSVMCFTTRREYAAGRSSLCDACSEFFGDPLTCVQRAIRDEMAQNPGEQRSQIATHGSGNGMGISVRTRDTGRTRVISLSLAVA